MRQDCNLHIKYKGFLEKKSMKRKGLKRKGLKRRDAIECACFVLPGLLYMLCIIGYPMIYNIIISFQDVSVMTFAQKVKEFVSWENYRYLFQNDIILQVLKQTFVFTFFCIFFQLGIGLLLALFFNGNFRTARPVRGLLLVIWVVPMTVVALIFKFIFQTDGGLINTVLLSLHLVKEPVEWLVDKNMAMVGVIIANCWVGIPFNMILLTSGLSSISTEIYESASIDGANGFAKFRCITLPLLRPAIMSVLILGVIYTFKVFDLVWVMTAGGPTNGTHLLSTYSYKLSFSDYQFSRGAAAANILMICLLIVSLIYINLIKKDEVM